MSARPARLSTSAAMSRWMSLNEVMKDDVFFRSSGGGVTLSGGEVLMQAPFATQFTAAAPFRRTYGH
jgi:pyruvate-formate lyase-activating enzyme